MRKKILLPLVTVSALSLMSFDKANQTESESSARKFWGTETTFHDSVDAASGCVTHYADYHYYALWVNYDNLNNVVLGVDCP